MSHAVQLTDEQYGMLEQAAAARGQSIHALLEALIEELRERDREPHYYETDEWLRHLGLTEEQIAESARLAAEADDADA